MKPQTTINILVNVGGMHDLPNRFSIGDDVDITGIAIPNPLFIY